MTLIYMMTTMMIMIKRMIILINREEIIGVAEEYRIYVEDEVLV